MRYPAEEKLEIIRLVERSARPAKWTLDKLGVSRRTFYRWYDRYLTEGADGLVDRAPMPKIVWNRIPDNIRADLHKMALDEPELSPRELAVKFTDTKGYFVSCAAVSPRARRTSTSRNLAIISSGFSLLPIIQLHI